jgi:hypothetical protein
MDKEHYNRKWPFPRAQLRAAAAHQSAHVRYAVELSKIFRSTTYQRNNEPS